LGFHYSKHTHFSILIIQKTSPALSLFKTVTVSGEAHFWQVGACFPFQFWAFEIPHLSVRAVAVALAAAFAAAEWRWKSGRGGGSRAAAARRQRGGGVGGGGGGVGGRVAAAAAAAAAARWRRLF
jgi:hypothetical protein